MISKGEIWAVVEHAEGAVKEVTYEVLNAARTLADGGGGRVTAVCLGAEENIALEPLFRHGADRVLFLKHEQLANYTNAAYRAALLSSFEGDCPELILLPATVQGKELAPGLAAELGGGLATDCVAIEMDGDRSLTVKRPVFGGKAISTICFEDSVPKIITLRPNVFRGAGGDTSRTGKVEVREVSPISLRVKIKEVIREVGGNLNIAEARIVVSGGMGMRNAENFKLVEDLAEVLGAAVGASRPVVDGGWRPYSNQVGQTGGTVTPDLYIACGISGAVQHLAGMSSSKNIVAINKDPNAPIFSIADYGILGDVLEVLPILTQELRKAKGQ